jgi:DNA replicative helicase MCM subunit Mcm2 (Cdc46/Mcm family)
LFQTFIREHKIQMILDGEEAEEVGEDDDYDYEPNDSSTTIKKISCFTTLLQRIKDRNYYDYSSIQRRGKGSRSSVFVIEVPIDELEAWDPVRSEDMVNHALHNTSRYIDLFSSVIDEQLHSMSSTGNNNMPRDSIDILHDQRLLAAQQASQRRAAEENNNGDNDGGIQNDAAANTARNNGVTQDFPPILMRRYELRILPRGRRGKFPPFDKQYHPKKGSLSLGSIEFGPVGGPLRQVRSSSIGHLVTIRGMIVRASDVKPCCVVATYSCDACGSEIYQVIQSKREFMPQRECPSAICKHNGNNRESLHLQSRGSKFVKFQELKLQELPSQVPMYVAIISTSYSFYDV